MTIEYLTSGCESHLILIFAGWSTCVDHYRECVFPGWDTAVVSDYRDLTPPEIPSRYKTVYIFAYSLGVFAASLCDMHAAVSVAICGTERPVSDMYGIPEKIYIGTEKTLNERNLMKFHHRMAGDRESYTRLCEVLPKYPSIDILRDELTAIRTSDESVCGRKWHRAYVADSDAIFPPQNQMRFWQSAHETELVNLSGPHAVDIASVIRSVLPDPSIVGGCFEEALPRYRQYATVQAEICEKIGDMLAAHQSRDSNIETGIESVLELGAGCGMLTDIWSRRIKANKATFVDLYQLPSFDVAPMENYVTADAERWLEETDETFDLILSASAIQWFADPVRFLSIVKNHLRPGGFAILSTFVCGNLEELDSLRPSPIIYHSVEDYKKSAPCESEIITWSRVLEFNNRKEMLMHLRRTGVTGPGKFAIRRLTDYPLSLTYKPLIVLISS